MSSREAVLSLLRGEEGFLSGQELSRRLKLSRAAVWKAVDALRGEGYEIEARTGLGYRLTAAPDVLTEAEIRSFLGPTRLVGRELRCFEELDSTNNYLKSWTDGPDGAAVTAESQTAGRGRMDRSFQSPRGQGIYLSVLLRPPLPPDRLPPVTALAGVAVCAAVERVCGARPGLKWPNDPVLCGKKLCGILTELSLEAETGRVQSLVLGIGVNVGQGEEDFSFGLSCGLPEPLRKPGENRPASSLRRRGAGDRPGGGHRRGIRPGGPGGGREGAGGPLRRGLRPGPVGLYGVTIRKEAFQ